MGNINSILKNVLEKINPEKDLKKIESELSSFLKNLNNKVKKLKIDAEIFVGGSYAKGTLIKKDKYDIDVFLRFQTKKYKNEEISKLAEKILKSANEKYSITHGSRDYFKIKKNNDFFIELVPVMKISKPEKAENITDLSYSHVKFIKRKLKKNQLNEVRLAKAFCYANKCYGAEGYINGFSGYALELLTLHYKNFLNLLKEMVKVKENEKLVIDIKKYYKNKKQVLIDLNTSKLKSPIILIDPTYKQRNALAALSKETFEKFKQACKDFLKNQSIENFELKKTDLEKIKNKAEKNKNEFILLEATTSKQDGDMAGSKLFKFYNFLTKEILKFFEIKDKGFNYNNKQAARYYFVAKSKKDIRFSGPRLEQREHVKAFEKSHPNYSIKSGKLLAREKVDFTIQEFIKDWKKKNAKKIKDMVIKNFKFVN